MYTIPLSLLFCATALLVNGAYASDSSSKPAELRSAALEFQPSAPSEGEDGQLQTLEGLAQPQPQVRELPAVSVGQAAMWVRIADDGERGTAVCQPVIEQPSVRWVF